jgi:hypothetical protein
VTFNPVFFSFFPPLTQVGATLVLLQVAKRLERTAGQFKRLGSLGFWGQLVCTVVAAVILAFSVVITGQATSPVSIYLTAAGIAAAFLSVFWSFGYIRLAQKLRDTIGNPTKVPTTSPWHTQTLLSRFLYSKAANLVVYEGTSSGSGGEESEERNHHQLAWNGSDVAGLASHGGSAGCQSPHLLRHPLFARSPSRLQSSPCS